MKQDSKHFQSFNQLVLGAFPHQFASMVYPYEKDHDAIMFQAMDEVSEPGPDSVDTFIRHDALVTFIPEKDRTQRPVETETGESWATHVSVEIKVNKEDLMKNGFKVLRYLGATDFFFLAVQKRLLEEAVRLIQQQTLSVSLDHIGLIDLTTGEIVIYPQRQHEKDKYRQAILCQRAWEQSKRVCVPEPVYLPHTTKTVPTDRPKICEVGPFAVNKKYLTLVRSNLNK